MEQSLQAEERDLAALIQEGACAEGPTPTAWPFLSLIRMTRPMPRTPIVYHPCLCVVVQGRKRVYLGDEPFDYNPRSYLLCSLPLPVESEVIEASVRRPLLGIVLRFDPAQVAKVASDMEEFVAWPPSDENLPAVTTGELTPTMTRTIARLIRVQQDPMDRRVLGPGLEREIIYELLRGPNGRLLRHLAVRDESTYRIYRVVHFLEQNYKRQLDVGSIAKRAGMSPSALHAHFKQATTLSPIQFIKRMRLHQARALLLGGRGPGEAAFEVGYSNPSQFSREFRRMFGCSPKEIAPAAMA